MPNKPMNIVMTGATGAVGTEVVKSLCKNGNVHQLTLLGRRSFTAVDAPTIQQHTIDLLNPESYQSLLVNHQAAICTVGVGQPSKVSKEQFLKIDYQAVLDFARSCKKAEVQHFSLLSSVGIDATSSVFYLQSKGKLVEEIKALNFTRFSVFQPSMILTPENRYGLAQAITLKVWPLLKPLLQGGLKKYRGIRVEDLGVAIADNVFLEKEGVEYLSWEDFF